MNVIDEIVADKIEAETLKNDLAFAYQAGGASPIAEVRAPSGCPLT
ncbi:MAG: hypothetical protein ACREQF_00500 [Candidatus Binataceae bacterium]